MNNIELNDEFDRDEIYDYMNKINNLIIKAVTLHNISKCLV